MADFTPNYNLKKPAPEDFYNVQDFNDNMDKIDTALKQLADRPQFKSATIVVGNTGAGHTLADCDYLCSGEYDEEVINEAIEALPATGGKVLLLEGTYNISNRSRFDYETLTRIEGFIIIDKNNVTLQGQGNGTILKAIKAYDRTHSAYGANVGLITFGAHNCCICDLLVDGNSKGGVGVTFFGSYGRNKTINVDITGCAIGIYMDNPAASQVMNCNLYDNNNGIICYDTRDCIISNNTITKSTPWETNQYSIDIGLACYGGMVVNNVVKGKNVNDASAGAVLVANNKS